MDISAFPQSDPLIVLLNEIEILRAQIRLLELHVKRVQSLTGDRMAQLQADYQRELTALRSTLFANEESEIAARTQTKLQQEVPLLEARLAAERRELAERDAEILRARSAMAGMRDRIDQLEAESAERQRGVQSQVTETDDRLRGVSDSRDQALQEQRAVAHANERRLRGNLLDAHKELGEQSALVAAVEERLRAAVERSMALEQRVGQLEVANDQLTVQAHRLQEDCRSQAEDIETLRHQTAVQEQALVGRHEAVTAVELALHEKIQMLQRDLASSRRGIDERDQNLARERTAGEAMRRAYETEIAALRAAMNGLESQKTHLEAAHQAVQENHRRAEDQGEKRSQAKITELQLQLAERQLLAERRAAEIADLKNVIRGLGKEITHLEITALARQQAALENLALAPTTQLQKLESRIDEQRAIESRAGEQARSLAQQIGRLADQRRDGTQNVDQTHKASEEHTAMKNDETDQEVASRDAGEHPLPGGAEQSLRDEITRLQREAQEKNQILQDRNEELVRVKAQLDQLQERMAHLESSSSRDENSFHDEAERMRTEFQAQLALLQAELSQREWALEERQAKAHTVEQTLRHELETVHRRLASKNDADGAAREFVFDAPSAHLNGEEAFELNGGNQSTPPGSFASHRRWNRGLSWKRRWKS